MIKSRFDKTLVFLSVFFIVFGVYFLFIKPFSESEEGFKVSAIVKMMNETVKLRGAGELTWVDAYLGDHLSKNQYVFTAKNSSAHIETNSGSQFTLGESTLIKIEDDQESFSLKEGVLNLTLRKGKTVDLEGKKLKAEDERVQIQISKSKEQSSITVIDGKASFGQNNEVLQKNERLELNQERVKKVQLQASLVSPLIGQKYYSSDSETINFKADSSITGAQIIVASDRAFKKILFKLSLVDSVVLPQGSYYWGVVKDGKLLSVLGSFDISPYKKLLVNFPENGHVFTYPLKKREKTPKLFENFIIENPNAFLIDHQVIYPNGTVKTKKSSHSLVQFGLDSEGKYKWKFRPSMNSPGYQTNWQEVAFWVRTIPYPQRIELNQDRVILYRWEGEELNYPLLEKSEYPLEVKVNNDFQKFNVNERPLIKFNKTGDFVVQVRGIDKYLRKSPWSQKKEVQVRDVSFNSSPTKGAILEIERPGKLVEFKWEANEKATNYILTLTGEGINQNIQSKTATLSVPINDVGTYFWSVKFYDKNGKEFYSRPVQVHVRPNPPPEKPAAPPDIKTELIIEKTTRFFQRIIEFIFPRAYGATQDSGSIYINVPLKQNVKIYHIRIRLKESGVIVKEIYSQKTKVKVSPISSGEYLWDYSVIDFWERESEFSDSAKLTIQQKKILPKTTVKKKKVLSSKKSQKGILPGVISTKKKLVKKKTKFSLFQVLWNPKKIDYELDDKQFNGEISGNNLNSMALSYHHLFEGNYYSLVVNRSSGEVFNEVAFNYYDIGLQWGPYFRRGFNYQLGLSYLSYSYYEIATPNTLSVSQETGFTLNFDLFYRFKKNVDVGSKFKALTYNAGEIFLRKVSDWNDKFYLSYGVNYLYGVYSQELGDITTQGAGVELGLGAKF